MIIDKIFLDIKSELERATSKYKGNSDTLDALSCELGELIKAVMSPKYKPAENVTNQDIYEEAIQVATMAIKFILIGDENYPYKFDEIMAGSMSDNSESGVLEPSFWEYPCRRF